MAKSMRLSGGGRFAALKEKLRRRGVRNPAALAAEIGRGTYGKKRFQEMAAEGRRRAAAERKRAAAKAAAARSRKAKAAKKKKGK